MMFRVKALFKLYIPTEMVSPKTNQNESYHIGRMIEKWNKDGSIGECLVSEVDVSMERTLTE